MEKHIGYKSVLSFILSLLIVFSCISPVYAANKTLESEDIVAYLNSRVGQSYPSGHCLAFVADSFKALGATRSSTCCAYNYGSSHIQSTSSTNIPIGADVFFGNCGGGPCGTCKASYYGHVGIYVGDGYFIHATGGVVQKSKLSAWSTKYRGWGYHSNITVVASGTTSTSAVEITSAKPANTSSITLKWKAASNAKSYRIDRRKAGDSGYSTIKTGISSATTTYTDTGLATGTHYCYRVYAVYSDGSTSAKPAGHWCWTIPASPTLTSAVGSSATSVTLKWKAVSGAEFYRIDRRSEDDNGYTTIVSDLESDTLTYKDTSVKSGKQYCYRIYAINSDGVSAKPAGVWACTRPTISKVSTGSDTALTVSWGEIAGAAKYNVYRRKSGDESYTKIKSGVTSLSYADSGLNSGTTYWYRVTAVDSSGNESAQSESVSGVTLPAKPTLVSAVGSSTTSVTLTWKAVSGAESYRVDRRSADEENYTTIATNIKSTVLTYKDTGIKDGKQYCYRIYAVNSGGTSAKPDGTWACTRPALSKVNSDSDTALTVSWGKITGAAKYNVYRRKSGDESYTKIKSGVTSLSYTDSGLSPGTKYWYKVTAVDASGNESVQSEGLNGVTKPSSPVITTLSSTSLKISWSSVLGQPDAQFKLYRKASTDSSYTCITTTTSTSYEDKNLNPNTTYRYYFDVKTADGKTTLCVSLAGESKTALATPVLSGIKNAGNGVTVSWSAVSGASGYVVYRKTGSENWTAITEAVTGTSYTDTTVKSGTTYVYTVRAIRDTYANASANKYNLYYWSDYDHTGKSITYSNTVAVTAVSLNQKTATMTSAGETLQLKATVTPEGASNKNVTWSSSNSAVATVSSSGLVKAVGNGTATITVKTADGGKTATCQVTVNIPAEITTGKISAANVSGKTGQIVKVPINLDANPGIIAVQCRVTYDASKVKLVNVEGGNILDCSALKPEYTDNPYIISLGDELSTANITSTGTLVTMSFEILPEFTKGNTAIKVTFDEAYDKDVKAVAFTSVDGSITAASYLVGDVNSDGAVKLNDAILLRRYVAGWDVSIDMQAADVNGDGAVKLNDAILLRRYTAGWNVSLAGE